MSKKIKHLVVDTTAFIKCANLQDMADNIYTIQEVCDEITNDRQRRKLIVLPYELVVKEVLIENVKFITEFSKKTGDYPSLSATDIKVIALTYQIEKEKCGTAHLKTEPTMQRTINVTGLSHFKSQPEATAAQENNSESTETVAANTAPNTEDTTVENIVSQSTEKCENGEIEMNKVHIQDDKNESEDEQLANEIAEQVKRMDLRDGKEVDELIVKVSDEVEESESEEDSDSDGGEWITPGNIENKKREIDGGEFEDKEVDVACVTSDFAMQNVLKQIGLNVTSVDGRIIKQLRTFIFRCTTCFKTTSVMTKLFCPKCGHATLKKVGVSYDSDGNQVLHINGRKPLTARGKRFSLPTPRGGHHFQYPILTEDQHIHKNFATKLGRSKTKALDPDYIAGYSPFAVRDVNSRSAVLGIKADKQDLKYWMKHYSKGKKK